jgi:hypothetical protein
VARLDGFEVLRERECRTNADRNASVNVRLGDPRQPRADLEQHHETVHFTNGGYLNYFSYFNYFNVTLFAAAQCSTAFVMSGVDMPVVKVHDRRVARVNSASHFEEYQNVP